MRKSRPKPSRRSRLRGFLLLAAITGLLAASLLALQYGHRLPSAKGGLHCEPGWLPEHKSDRWTCIVIHHSADEDGGADKYDEIHRNEKGWDELGYHFVIGNGSQSGDGEVEIGPRWVKQKYGAHCKTNDNYYNNHGIGICLVGNFNNHPPDLAQMQSLARLVRFLCIEFKIPTSAIYTHRGVTGKTECPGKDFDLEQLKRMVAAEDAASNRK